MQKGNPVDVIYVDFKKAFDKVPHERLVMKLKAYGITSKLLNWIHSFLKGRKQRVTINGFKSTLDRCCLRCTTRLCFGSCFLFNIYQ